MGSSGWFISIFLLSSIAWAVTKDIRMFKKCWFILGGICPDNKYISIHLYTRQNKHESQLIKITDTKDNLNNTNFNSSHPNKLIIHGFNPHLFNTSLVSVRDAYLKKGEANIWMVDWSKLSNGGMCTPFSLQNSGHVGRCLSQLIFAIQRHSEEAQVHVIAMGAGTYVTNHLAHSIQPIVLTRITGLNPATLVTQNNDQKLDSSDAEFVDIIHTTPFIQHSDNMGHVDFYMNPGWIHQPGCKAVKNSFECDRRRALDYFAESINSEVKFLGWACDSYAQYLMGMCEPEPEVEELGNNCSDWARGTYIAYTASESPYALGNWNETLYKEKGPKVRTDKLSQISTNIKKKMNLIKESTPEQIQDLNLLGAVKDQLDEKAEQIKSKTTRAGLAHAKNIAEGIYQHTVGRFGKHTDTNDHSVNQ